MRALQKIFKVLPFLVLLLSIIVMFKSSLRLNYFRYETFNSNKFDLGIMAQTVWNTAHGRFFEYTDHYGMNISQAATHTDYLMVLFAPLFLIWEDPRVLLFVQGLILASGAIPLFLLARKKLKSDWIGLLWGLAFLVYPAVGFLLRSDFHSVTLTIPLFLWAFYLLEKNWLIPFWVCIILALLGKEEVSLIVFMLGLYIWLVRKRKRLGATVALVGFLWAMLCFLVIIPYYGRVRQQGYEEFLGLLYGQFDEQRVGISQNFFLERYSQFGNSYFEIAKNILFRPLNTLRFVLSSENLVYLFKVFSPLGFISFLAPLVLLISLPEFLINLLSNNLTMKTIGFQYVAAIVPFVFLSALYGVVWLREKAGGRGKRFLVPALSVVVLFGSLWGTAEFENPLWPYLKSGGPLVKIPQTIARIKERFVVEEEVGVIEKPTEVAEKPEEKERLVGELIPDLSLTNPKHNGAAADVVSLIPKEPTVSVSVPNFLGAHLSLRESSALFPGNYQKADYVVVDLVLPQFLHSVGDFEITSLIPRYVKELLEKPDYTLIRSGNGLLVFERGNGTSKRPGLSLLERPGLANARVSFDKGIVLSDFHLPEGIAVGEKIKLSFDWSVSSDLKKSVFFVSTLKNNGRICQEVHLPSFALLLVDQWEQGKIYHEEFEVILPENLLAGDYEFILTVVDFDNREDVESRFLQMVEVE